MLKFRLVSTVFIFLFLTIQSHAQRRFDAGIVAGANFSQVDGDDLGGYHRVGFIGGGRVDTRFTDRWRLSLEILFSQLGSDRSRYDYPGYYDNIRLNYVEVPVSVKFRDWLIEDDFYRIEVSAGLSYARLINYKAVDLTGADVTDNLDYDSNSLFVQVGAGYFINRHWGIYGLWAKALTDLDADEGEVLLSRFVTVKAIYMF